MRLLFMGTPEFSVPSLQALLAGEHPILGVVTQPDRPRGRGQKLEYSPVKQTALAAGIAVLQPAKIRAREVIGQVQDLAPDLIVTVAYGQILPKAILDIPALGCINVHASLLPKYRGAAPIHWAVIRGEEVTGITIMYMDVGMDTGDIILQRAVPIGPTDTTGLVHDHLAGLGAELLIETIDLMAGGKAPRRSQEGTEATYAPLLTRGDEEIVWERPAGSIHNLIRGMNPWPGAYTVVDGRILKVYGSEVLAATTETEAPASGTVTRIWHGRGVAVSTGTGILLLTQVKPENGKLMAADAYARGNRLAEGQVLGRVADGLR